MKIGHMGRIALYPSIITMHFLSWDQTTREVGWIALYPWALLVRCTVLQFDGDVNHCNLKEEMIPCLPSSLKVNATSDDILKMGFKQR